MKPRLGVDTGGTFTDFVHLDADGRLHIHKQLSTPADPSRAILSGIDTMAVAANTAIVHGSTVATNALLERRGARTALITTAGFRDLLAIGRQNRPDLYALVPQKPPPLVPRAWRFTVAERVTAAGEPLQPLQEDSLAPLIERLREEQIESTAVCLLFSFLYPHHERRIAAALRRALPDLHISLSVDILPEYREYERTATTVINAYVAPLMDRYLRRLQQQVQPRPLAVMQSNGGIISAATAGAEAARTALSGPAGGVVGAHHIAAQAGFPEIITFDMGGTSTDVALCPGRLPTTARGEIADLPLRLPIIDIHTVGAGGGSLAAIDAGGALHVGPQSAGADPGPACYGRTTASRTLPADGRATVTDANLLLGRLDADHFLGGEMRLDEAAARTALTALAQKMGAPDPETAAWGVIQLANANMERAVRKISVERGHDPRRFTLVPFGGAGPLHACDLAQQLGIPRVLIPAIPGVLSALGMLVAAPTRDYSQTVMLTLTSAGGELAPLHAALDTLRGRAVTEMSAEGYDAAALTMRASLDMRYHGQSHELTVPYAAETAAELRQRFHDAHHLRYGYAQQEAALELVNARISAAAPLPSPPLTRAGTGRAAPAPPAGTTAHARIGEKQAWFDRRPQTTPLLERDKLLPNQPFAGPAIVLQYDTTIVIPPDWTATVDPAYNLILTRE